MTAQHTPWEFYRIDSRYEQKDGFGFVRDAEGRDILHVGELSLSEAENVAIGEIAAAAPNLLYACQILVRLVGLKVLGDTPSEVKTALAAIAKANGSTAP